MTDLKKKSAKKSKPLSIKKNTLRDLDVNVAKGSAIRGGGGKSAKCLNSDGCPSVLANCTV